MPFQNISSLNSAAVGSTNYFVDANVWIYSLQSFGELENWKANYYTFFYDIIESNLDPQPKIIVPALLLSEIVNTFLRQIAIPEYKLSMGIDAKDKFDFKRGYRHTAHHKDSFERIMDDIGGLHSSLLFLDDSGIVGKPSLLLNKSIGSIDYNDYLYYSLCKEFSKKDGVVILTNDGDFVVDDLPIITLNRNLLGLRS
jgi:hypothetical protein